MMGTIEHRVVKGLLTARPREGIESVNLEEKLLESYTNEGQMNQERLSDEQVNMLIHTPLSTGISSVPTGVSDGVRVVRTSVDIDDVIYTGTERNAPCPCGSGKKYKQCHGKK
jgi:preprotein translocase subunit SecA